ncbi:MAG: glutamate--cysteine ligase [Pseudomonadales bacterium]
MQDVFTDSPKPARSFDVGLEFLSDTTVLASLSKIQRGIEKEGLRVTASGGLAQTPHPPALGSALCNSWITTDFSESLLEFITPAYENITTTLDYLGDAHTIVAGILQDEVIWTASMPCKLPKDNDIPLARYGKSNIAIMKTAYRRGLGHRYGRAMQTVAGIHYNFSLPEEYWRLEYESLQSGSDSRQTSSKNLSRGNLRRYIDERYFDLIRNFRRNYWLLIYLFGSAPCVDSSFLNGREHTLQRLGDRDFYLPHATSLRMGDLGYQSVVQKSLFVCYNDLNNYIATLKGAIDTPYLPYEKIGTNLNGEYQQLSQGILQIENEFYSAVRPKRSTETGEKPLHALRERGIQYIEVRCMDINPFMQLGIDATTMRFLDAFLLYCAALPSPQCDENEFTQIAENQALVVNRGRDPTLALRQKDSTAPLQALATTMLEGIARVADKLDLAAGCGDSQASKLDSHHCAVQRQQEKLADNNLTPSATLLRELKNSGQSFTEFVYERSAGYMHEHRARALQESRRNEFMALAEQSLESQADIERADNMPFDAYLKQYYAS